MAIVTANPNQATKKPDIFDVVEDPDLAETPIYNMIEKASPPENDEFQWPADVPDAPVATGTADGLAWTDQPATNFGGRGWIKGRIHHKETNYGVGIVAQGNEVAGTNGQKEFAYQGKRAARRHVKDWELILVGNQDGKVGDNAIAFETRGLELWISADGAGQVVPDQVNAAFRTEALAVKSLASVSAMVEEDINDVMAAITNYLKRRGKWFAPCTLAFKRKVSSWGNLQPVPASTVSVRRFNRDADEKRLGQIIDIYFGDAGEVTFQTHFFLRTGTAKMECAMLDMSTIRLRMRHNPQAKQLPADGTRLRGQIFSTGGLQVGNPKFLGKFVVP
jgi:hypothetical protein